MSFIYQPRRVTPELREAALDLYPALARDGRAAWQYRRIFAHLLYTNFVEDDGRRITPFRTIQVLADDFSHKAGRGAGKILRSFSEEVMEVGITPADWERGLARSVAVGFAPEIVDLKSAALPRVPTAPGGRVCFVSGETTSAQAWAQQTQAYRCELQRRAAMPEDHPMSGLAGVLNSQSPHSLTRRIHQNWEAVWLTLQETPPGLRRDLTENVLYYLLDFPPLPLYGAVDRSPRIFGQGVNLTQLPREVRPLLLGGYQLDLRAAQLAVVSKLWRLDELRVFLADGGPIWAELSVCAGLEGKLDIYKPVLKDALYGCLFGAAQHNLRKALVLPRGGLPGLDLEQADGLLGHSFIAVLLERREIEMKRIQDEGGCRDAFGRWLPYRGGGRPELRSLMCQEVQSYEARLMLPLLPVIQAERDLRVHVWLHDGLVLHFNDPAKRNRILMRMERVVQDEAEVLGIPTWLER